MLAVHSLSFEYPDKPLFRELQWSLPAGQLLHLRGGNGTGKTTLLRLLAGLLRPTGGEVCWNQQSIYYDLPAFQRQLCYVGHKSGITLSLTVRENCVFDLQWSPESPSMEDMLARFDMADLANTPCALLSQGQKRRVALLRIVMSNVRLWLLDEPFVALDEPSTRLLTTCLKQHLAEQGLIVLTSHQSLPADLTGYEVYSL